MKVKELLEITKTEPLESVAKNHLSIGKQKALKAVGCYPKAGVSGWFYDGDPAGTKYL